MNAWGTVYCIQKERSLFVCWVICFQSQNETSKLSPEVASILVAFLRNTRLNVNDVVCLKEKDASPNFNRENDSEYYYKLVCDFLQV